MGEWDTGIPVNCWSEGSSIQQCLSWCVLRHHHGFCYYWGRGRFRGATRVGKSFVSFCGQVWGFILYILRLGVIVLLFGSVVLLFVLLHLFQTTLTLANWQMSFIHIFCVFLSNESSYQELLSVCCLAVLACLTPKSCITWIQLHPGHRIDGWNDDSNRLVWGSFIL